MICTAVDAKKITHCEHADTGVGGRSMGIADVAYVNIRGARFNQEIGTETHLPPCHHHH